MNRIQVFIEQEVLHLDRLRTALFIYRLQRLLRKYKFSREEALDVVSFALHIRHAREVETK